MGAYKRGLATAVLGVVFGLSPFDITLDIDSGLRLTPHIAWAKDGDRGDSGNSGSGNQNNDSDDRDDRDDRDDDKDDHGSKAGPDDKRKSKKRQHKRASIKSMVITGDHVAFDYADGSRDEIAAGRYRRIAPDGQVVETRRATGADISRLRALANKLTIRSVAKSKGQSGQSKTRRAIIAGASITIEYTNGWTEHVSASRYRLIDPYNRVVADRPATKDDHKRLRKTAKP